MLFVSWFMMCLNYVLIFWFPTNEKKCTLIRSLFFICSRVGCPRNSHKYESRLYLEFRSLLFLQSRHLFCLRRSFDEQWGALLIFSHFVLFEDCLKVLKDNLLLLLRNKTTKSKNRGTKTKNNFSRYLKE